MDHLDLYWLYIAFPTTCRKVLTKCDKKEIKKARWLLNFWLQVIERAIKASFKNFMQKSFDQKLQLNKLEERTFGTPCTHD